jgi:hypothetical protein
VALLISCHQIEIPKVCDFKLFKITLKMFFESKQQFSRLLNGFLLCLKSQVTVKHAVYFIIVATLC